MDFSRYCKDRLVSVVIVLISIAMVALMLYVFDLDRAAIVFVCLVIAVAFFCTLVFDYFKRRRFYNELRQTLDQLVESYLICELLGRPDFYEGTLAYDALMQATKAMNDRIASYRISSEEYREYIETWIHEIKTPIAAAHLLAQNHPDEVAHAMDGEVDRIEGFVEQALYYSRSSAIEKDYHIREVNLSRLVKEVVRRNARLLIENKVTPRLGDLNYEVYADAKWVSFILGQLIGNAVKYRKADTGEDAPGAPTVLRFSAEQLDAGLDSVRTVLHVTDNGIGIPAEDLPRVFDKGFTGMNGRRFAKSTGIGLYLCKQLCTKMGLDIAIESTQGKGATVSISFPQNKVCFFE